MKTPLYALLLLAACGAPSTTLSGRQAVPDAASALLKTAAVSGAQAEIALNSENTGLRVGTYLDTLVGPTPPAALFERSHPRAWLDAMVSTHQVDGVFGVPTRAGPGRNVFAIEVGEPFPGGRDTVEIAYAWCVRRFPTRAGTAGAPKAWRDQFIHSDTGWARVAHLPAVAPSACTP